jgi:hypothetical protein
LPNCLPGEQTLRQIMIGVVVAIGFATLGGQARAGIVIDVSQVGANVVATGGGTIDLTDLSLAVSALDVPFLGIDPAIGVINMGGHTSSALVNVYTGFTGPSSFGTGSGAPITSGSGDRFGINDVHQDGLPGLTLPVGYVTGTELTAADTYNDQSLLTLGLTPGTYTWTWGTGSHADFFTLLIVPEPSSVVLASIGAVGAFLAYGWSRHRRQQRRMAAA